MNDFSGMDALYRDFILEHYKRPRNFGELRVRERRGGAIERQPAVEVQVGYALG